MRFVIVGMGPAGLSAAEVIRHHQPSATITMIADDPHGYYSRPGLAYLLDQEVPEAQLFPLDRARWDHLAIERLHAHVTQVDPQAHNVSTDTGQHIPYDRLLLATGSVAVPLNVPGIELDGVVTLDSLEDARQIMRRAKRAREAVVIGGGVTAIEIVEGLRARGVHVHYLMRGDRYWRSVLDEDESRMVEERLGREGVTVHHRTEVARILGKRGWLSREKVSGVETTDGRQIPCQIAAVAIGVRPHMELVAGTGIEIDRGILVNDHLETSVPGIYAAGDVAQAYDALTGRAQLDVLWSVAVAQGRVAGANMAGPQTIYERGIPFNVTRLTGLVVSLIGAVGTRGGPDADLVTISRGDSEVWRGVSNTITVHEEHDADNQRLIISDNRLVGAILIGDQSSFLTAYRLIQERVDISAYLPAVHSPHADLAQVLARASEETR